MTRPSAIPITVANGVATGVVVLLAGVMVLGMWQAGELAWWVVCWVGGWE